MAPHSSTLAWGIPWTEEPGGLQSVGSRRVGHDWATSLSFSLSCTGEGNGTHSSALAWRIPGTGEPGGLPSMESHRVGHDWCYLAAAAAADYFHILKIVNNASMNIGMHVSMWISIFLDVWVTLLSHMVVLFLFFWETFILCSIVAVPFYIPSNSRQGFSFLHNLTNIY